MIRPYGRPIEAGKPNTRDQLHFTLEEPMTNSAPQRRRRAAAPAPVKPDPVEPVLQFDEEGDAVSAPIQVVPEKILKELDKSLRLACEFPQVMGIFMHMVPAIRAMLYTMSQFSKPAGDPWLVFHKRRRTLYEEVVKTFTLNTHLPEEDFPLSEEHLLNFWAKVRRENGRKHILAKLVGVDFSRLDAESLLRLGTEFDEELQQYVPTKKKSD